MTTVERAVAYTPVHDFGGWTAKREDLAHYTGADAPSGAKVRQYLAMTERAAPDAAFLVGCSADSAMQVYVAHTAATHGRPGVVVVPARRKRSAATQWAAEQGAEIVEVRPGYPSVYRGRARQIGRERGGAVRWLPAYAAHDTAEQVANLPSDTRRVVIPSGSGLTAAGVLYGLAQRSMHSTEVVAVAVSGLTTAERIEASARSFFAHYFLPLPALTVVRHASPYGKPRDAELPDGMRLDPYYAAKALEFVRPGDCLWVCGRRPDSLR